jgi:hypothetical protein
MNVDFSEREKAVYRDLMTEKDMTHAEAIEMILGAREGRNDGQGARTAADAGGGGTMMTSWKKLNGQMPVSARIRDLLVWKRD